MCPTTSSNPTTARLEVSTTVRTPTSRIRGPVQPKNSESGQIRRNSRASNEAYRSPEASPAEIRMVRGTIISLKPGHPLKREPELQADFAIERRRRGHVTGQIGQAAILAKVRRRQVSLGRGVVGMIEGIESRGTGRHVVLAAGRWTRYAMPHA